MNDVELVATCANSHWHDNGDEIPCAGELRFRWGMSQAKCNICGAWCGVAVADWVRVEETA